MNTLPDVKPAPPAITVYRFRDAPAHLRALSDHGGDEDWLAVVPRQFWGHGEWEYEGPPEDEYDLPEFLRHLGVCRVSVHTLDPDTAVAIGAHS